jgi:hypothetical protein
MLELAAEVFKWIINRSDPLLVVLLGVLAVWQHRTSTVLAKHLDPENETPHPSCKQENAARETLFEQLDRQHKETREDIQELRKLIVGRTEE